MARRHYADDYLSAVEHLCQPVRRRHTWRNFEAWQERIILVALPDRFANFLLECPHPDIVRALAPKRNRQPRSPCSRANNGNAAQDRLPNFGSVPRTIRSRFERCFQITSTAAALIRMSTSD